MDFVCIENACLAPYCSMKVGGNAKYLVLPKSEEELISAISHFRKAGEKYIVVGNCSNLVFTDSGYDGAVIITAGIRWLSLEDNVITANCGETLSSLAKFACDNSLTGLEFCYGIPGTVGGAVYMNAGAYGGEMSQRFVSGRFLNDNGDIITLELNDMDFGYRKSCLNNQNLIMLSASFALEKGNSDEIKVIMDTLMAKRKASQPLEYPSCGSAFKRPVGHFAGALIEQCGLKGLTVGGAQVSEKHAGFIINRENASASNVIELLDLVSDIVLQKTGVKLEPEIRIIK